MSHATPAQLIARCFAARTSAHFAHLQARGYACHVALGEFYDAIVGVVDAYAECYQGVFGVIPTYPPVMPVSGELTPIKELREWLVKHREEASRGQSELGNQVDEILAVCDRAIYKIVNLK